MEILVSVIVRTKDEERWIGPCLRAVRGQKIGGRIELVLVDNFSNDRTVEKALDVWPDLRLVKIKNYKPGLAINEGVRASSGKYICCLSAHCLPVRSDWLAALLNGICDEKIAGVYGRQVPMSFSEATDKRDLLLTFGLDKRVQVKDTFFHNANSLFSRAIWEQFPFDETVSNIEDRVWGKGVIEAGLQIAYEPDAAVYHYHGIHQDNRPDRAENVVRIMESLRLHPESQAPDPLDPRAMEVLVLIPVRRHVPTDRAGLSDVLLRESIESAKRCKYVGRIVIVTDSEELATQAKRLGVEAPFVRPPELSEGGVRSDEVMRYALERLEDGGYYPDIVLPLEVTHPFRPEGLLDGLIEQLTSEGLDTVIAGVAEHRPCWIQGTRGVEQLTSYEQGRSQRPPVHVGLLSLGCATYPQFVRAGNRLGDRLGIYEIEDPFAAIEVRDPATLKLLAAWQERFRDPGGGV